jgi:hypothetical protein
MKKLIALSLGFFASLTGAMAQVQAPAKDSDGVQADLEGILNNAVGLFDGILPVVLAVVALSILIHFVKKVRKS